MMPPPFWLVVPFLLLLLLIAVAPLFLSHFWHKYYPYISVALGLFVVIYYILILQNAHAPTETLLEYFSFISLLFALFVISGGILIRLDFASTPLQNVLILFIGAILCNLIGTTGASVLLIRPFMRVNRNNLKPYHIVFFIFIISNAGGCLTPVGDPPLFIGFIKGIPFFWTLQHIWVIWLSTILLILAVFYLIEIRNYKTTEPLNRKKGFSIKGSKNFIGLLIILLAVFLDPSKLQFLPSIELGEKNYSFVRELIMIGTALYFYKKSDKECLIENDFNFEPIKEVAILFFGIFATMIPALELVSAYANSVEGKEAVTVNSLYWLTGTLSAFLDNAPTYLNFLTAAMSKAGLDINSTSDVMHFTVNNIKELIAISASAVFFGAMTYIGNGPNFMVKSIAEQSGIRMPSFFSYMLKYSIPVLLPIYVVIWWIYIY